MRQVTLNELYKLASNSRQAIWRLAKKYNRDPKLYLHWSAGHYTQKFDDYHINIDKDGGIFITTTDLAAVLAHTRLRNSGAIGLSIDCCVGATPKNLGKEPPTAKQIESMAKCIEVLADALWLTIDINHVLTHGEAGDNVDGLKTHKPYGPRSTVERWDLQFLGTKESPYYTTNYKSPITGGNVLRGKALWYKKNKRLHD